jgi:hypothetical protein
MLDINNDNKKNNKEINDKTMNTNATNNSNIANDHVKFLHQIPLFSGLTDQQLKTIEE